MPAKSGGMTAAQRNDLEDDDFAYIDSKGNRFLPIADVGHVRDAMSRFNQTSFESDSKKSTAHSKILAAAKKFGIKVANFSQDGADDVVLTVDFASDPSLDGDMVIRRGKLFACGDYPDKGFSLNEEELAEAVADFRPVPLALEHMPTVLDGKLGELTSITPSEDGKSLLGEARIPKWLDDVLDEGSRKVSATWHKASKRLLGLSLVRDPRVSDAALMAAFSASEPDRDTSTETVSEALAHFVTFAGKRHDTPSGQAAVQRLHDAAVREGAVCSRAQMASRHENQAIQSVHDMAAEHGATCEQPGTYGTGSYVGYSNYQTVPGLTPRWRPDSQDTDPLVGYSTTHTKLPAPAALSAPTNDLARITAPLRRTRMNIKEWLTGKAQEEGIDIDAADLEAAFSREPDPKIAQLEAQLAQEKEAREKAQSEHAAIFARQAGERRKVDAARSAEDLVRAHKIPPAAAAAFSAVLERAASLDENATFSEGEKSLGQLIDDLTAQLWDVSMFARQGFASDEQVALLTNQQTTPGVTGASESARTDVVDRMLEATPLGRERLKERAKNATSNGK